MTTVAARMGIDVGSVRIGVAIAPAGVALAVPLETVAAGSGDLERIGELLAEHGVAEVVVGDPIGMNGKPGKAAEAARTFARRLAVMSPNVMVRMVDERLSTVHSHRQLRSAGRNTRETRFVVDQAAAVAILQNAIDSQTATGQPAGRRMRPEG